MSYLFAAMVLLPLLLGLYIMATDKRPRAARKTAINGSGIVLAISLLFYYLYDTTQGGYQFLYSLSWMEGLGVQIRVGLDGLGLTMVLLTTILTFITLIFVDVNSYDATRYVVFILILQTMLTGVFVALDFILFYLFWELVLIPMYFMILEWGGANRRYAAIKFFLYTHVGSFIMLAGIIAMYFHHGSAEGFYTMNILEYLRYDFPREFQLLVFPMLFLGFAFKLPLVPFHTWLPDAHVEAPTAGSMLLAGVMLKMGGYGLIRFGFAIFPEAAVHYAWWMALLGVISMIYGAILALAQDDLKRMIAYSSVSHMGSVVLGLSALNLNGFNGAAFQLFAHGLISVMLFLICGIIQYAYRSRSIRGLRGVAQKMPMLGAFAVFAFMASIGLPGLAGFVAEIQVFMGAFPVYRTLTIAAIFSLVITAAYYLWALEKVFFGPANQLVLENRDDHLDPHEKTALFALAALILYFGIFPGRIMDLVGITNLEILARIGGGN